MLSRSPKRFLCAYFRVSFSTSIVQPGSFLVVEGRPAHCRVLSSIPGPRPLDASSTPSPPPVMTTKSIPSGSECSPWDHVTPN